MEPLEIDGGHGEGGGQIVRSAISLSCVTGTPVRITNIRSNRRVPGLRPQHLAAVRILQEITGAGVSGCEVGSCELAFSPSGMRKFEASRDVGTAGSITLVMQCVIPLAAITGRDISVTVRGGTDVPWSPTMDYSRTVLAAALDRMGIRATIEVAKRGYYPKGGGEATLTVSPSTPKPASFSRMDAKKARILCSYSQVSRKGMDAEVQGVAGALGGYDVEVDIARQDAAGRGASMLVCAVGGNTAFGADSLLDARTGRFKVDLADWGKFAIDRNLADMLVVPASLAAGKTSFDVGAITPHLETNLFVASKVTGCRYGIGRLPGGYRVIIEGASHPGV